MACRKLSRHAIGLAMKPRYAYEAVGLSVQWLGLKHITPLDNTNASNALYVSRCAANTRVCKYNDLKLSVLTTTTCCVGVAAGSAHHHHHHHIRLLEVVIRNQSWRRLSDRKLTAGNVSKCMSCWLWLWQPRLKIATLTVRIWRHVYSSRCAARSMYTPAWPPAAKSNLKVNFVQENINGRRMYAINTPRVSLNDDRYSAKSYSRKSTTDGKKNTQLWKSAQREENCKRAGCSKAEPKISAPPQNPFPGAQDGQNLISGRWSLP